MTLYLQKLAPDGLVLFHLSNRFLDLEPVVAGLARELRLEGRVRRDLRLTPARSRRGENGSIWAAVARTGRLPPALDGPSVWNRLDTIRRVRPWTDDYSSIINLLRAP
jgi:hypothetical protein